MFKKLQEYLFRISKGETVLALFILTNLVYLFMLFVTIPKLMQYSDGMKILDMMPGGYDLEYVMVLFDTLGEKGRQTYLFRQIPADMFYPGLYLVSYTLLFCYFLKKTGYLQSMFFYFSLLPVIGGVSDYIENFGIITMLKQYPDITQETFAISNTFSVIKSSSTTFFFIALLVLIVIFVVKYFRKK